MIAPLSHLVEKIIQYCISQQVVQEDDGTPDELFVELLRKAVEFLVASQPTQKDTAPIKECHHISFSYSTETLSFNEEDEIKSGLTPGLHVCYRGGQSLTCDSAFREAKRIFDDIIKGESDFLALSKRVEDAILYRDEHDSDDEKMVLESACTMIQAQTT